MKRITTLAVVAAAFVSSFTVAAGPAAAAEAGATPQVSQQNRMVRCNQEAKATGKTGPDRKAFMKACLSTGGAGKADKAAARAPRS